MPVSHQKPKPSVSKNLDSDRQSGKATSGTPGRSRHNNPLTGVRLVAMGKGMFVNFGVGDDK